MATPTAFFRVRFDRITLAERRYLCAMAELGPGSHRSGDIAAELGKKVTSLGPTRAQLIDKGMMWIGWRHNDRDHILRRTWQTFGFRAASGSPPRR